MGWNSDRNLSIILNARITLIYGKCDNCLSVLNRTTIYFWNHPVHTHTHTHTHTYVRKVLTERVQRSFFTNGHSRAHNFIRGDVHFPVFGASLLIPGSVRIFSRGQARLQPRTRRCSRLFPESERGRLSRLADLARFITRNRATRYQLTLG